MSTDDFWTSGYSRPELDQAQDRYDLVFPPDLIDLLLEKRPAQSPDWRTDEDAILERLAWPMEGILFDVENNDFWLSAWGARPSNVSDRNRLVREQVSAAPKLIPLFSHRYLPCEPSHSGNPVFSIHQTDVIYYGSDLDHYFANEIGSWTARDWASYRYIPF